MLIFKWSKTNSRQKQRTTFFEQNELLALLEEHRQEGHSNMQKIWSVYSFLVWYEIYFGTNPSWNRPVEKEPELASV